MANEQEIRTKLWKALKSDRTFMLGLADGRAGDSQPMTGLLEDDREDGPIWIFSSADVDLVQATGSGVEAVAQFVSKGHDVFASLHGLLSVTTDRAMVERLWNPFIAAWFKGGKDDPKLRLLRFDPDRAHIWLNENSMFAGIKLLLGSDPKKDYKDKVAEVSL
jgi:general stress protein 26